MRKPTVTLFAAALALSGACIHAQDHKPGEDEAPGAQPSTKAEKREAMKSGNAVSKDMVKKDEGRLDFPVTPPLKAEKASAQDKALGEAKRKQEGKDLAKKDEGRLEEPGFAPTNARNPHPVPLPLPKP